MSEIALPRINNFASEQANVSPEEPIFVLSSSQLQEIIKQAILEATEPLLERIEHLEITTVQQDEIRVKFEALENTVDQESGRLGLEIALDRQRLTRLEQKGPTEGQQKRGFILRSLLAAHGGKMLGKEARKIMDMDKGDFSRLLGTMTDYITCKPFHQDKRQSIIVLNSLGPTIND